MALKGLFPAVLGAVLLAGSAAMAADYRPDEFLNLDLSKAALSPKRLGPPTEFAPVAVEAKSDPSGVLWPNADVKKVAVRRVKGARLHAGLKSILHHQHRVAEARAEKRRGTARVRMAHRHGNPLNAQAMDTRIQKWPCNADSGGICAWRQ